MSNFQSENAKLVIGKVDDGPYMYLINKITDSLLMLRMNEKDKSIAVNAQINGAWGSEKLLATKDDLTNLTASGATVGGAIISTFKNEASNTVTKKITFSSNHCTALLIIDQNCETDILSVGRTSGLKEISKTSSTSYSFSNNTLTLELQQWGSMVVISPYKVTIS